MFYNHEILTSRKYGVAVVWLVATLGSRSYTRKVTKKDILGVNVPKTCDVIVSPDAPMALRLQSNLLAGVCRVYLQQCSYILTDAQNVQLDMRRLLRAVRDDGNIDPEAGRTARPELLLQPDDPTFLSGLDDLPSMELDLNELPSQPGSVLSPRSRVSSGPSFGAVPEIQIPSSSASRGGGVDLGLLFSGSHSGAAQSAQKRTEEHNRIDDDALLPEPDFAFDPDGNLYDIDMHQTIATEPLQTPLHHSPRMANIAPQRATSQAAQDMIGLHAQDAPPLKFDYEIPRDDDLPVGSANGAASSSERLRPRAEGQLIPSSPYRSSQLTSSSSSIVVPQRRKRVAKSIPLDKRTELRNSELLAFQHDYLSRMDKLNEKRLSAKALSLSKKNADWFTSGGGIGGIGFEVRRMGLDHPLAALCGQSLYDMLTGADVVSSTNKRDHANMAADDEHEPERRVRQRSDEDGRGAESAPMFEDGGLDVGAGDEEHDIEAGRIAAQHTISEPPSAGDLAGVMPWNITVAGGSSHRTLSSMQPAHLSRQLARLESQRVRSRSRLTSASPLHGRGHIPSRQVSLLRDLPPGAGSSSMGGGEVEMLEDIGGSAVMGPETQFQMFGPAAAVDTQTANQSQFIRAALDTESTNFLSFLEHTVAERGIDVDVNGIHRGPNDARQRDRSYFKKAVTFEQLLPSETNNRIVAAQGFLHALTLASRGLAWMRQSGWAGGENGRGGEWTFDGEMWLGVNQATLAGDASNSEQGDKRGSSGLRGDESQEREAQDEGEIARDEDNSEDELSL